MPDNPDGEEIIYARQAAIASIRAMREPTYNMTLQITAEEVDGANFDIVELRGVSIWQAMIDAALDGESK